MSSDQQSPKQDSTPTGLGAFWAELKRRKVMRVAITYAVAAWLIIQIASTTFGDFGIPVWAFRFVVIMLGLFFPVAIILAWAFELTPDGIKTTKVARQENVDTEEANAHSKKRNWLAYGVGALLPTAIFGSLALYFYVTRSGSTPPSPDLSPSALQFEKLEKSIAVLPLENMSPDPENTFFADGVQEDILTNLSKIEELGVVISRSSTLKYRDPDRNLKQVGQELGVRYIVEGSVRRAGNEVRITVQLIDANEDDHIWAETYNRTLDDIFAIQAEVAKRIAEELKAVLTPEEIEDLERRPTESQEAYDSYIKYRNLTGRGGSWDEKVSLLESAVAYDPDFTEAWACLAFESIFIWEVRNRKEPKLYARAYEAIEQAKRSDPDHAYIPYALSSFALREHHDPEKSIDYLLQALAIDPGMSLIHWRLGARYSILGRLAEAQHNLEIAVLKDPLSSSVNSGLMHTYATRGLWEQAFALIEENVARSTDSSWLMYASQYHYLKSGDKEAYRDGLLASQRNEYWPQYQLQAALIDRDYPKALTLLGEAKPESPVRFIGRRDFQIYRSDLAAALVHFVNDEKEEAIRVSVDAKAAYEEIIRENPSAFPTRWSELSICYALEGRADLVEEIIRKVRANSSTPYNQYYYQAHSELHIAIAHLVLGDHDKAIETLEAASKMDGPIFLNRELDLWFIFDRLRGNPRFDALLED